MPAKALTDAHFRLFAGAFLISFSPVFVRLVSVSPTVSGFYRTLFGGVALGIYFIARNRRFPPLGLWLLLAAACFALDLWFWHRSILLIGPGLSTLLANLQVFFMLAAGFILLRERPTRVQLVATPLALLGLTLILGRDWFALESGFRAGVVLGLLTAMSYAGYLLSMRQARTGALHAVPIPEVASVSLIVALLLGLASVAEGSTLSITSLGDLGWLLAYGLIAHACGLILIASSLTEVPAAGVGIALLLQPALSLVWDVLFFGKLLSPIEIAGVAITLIAIFLGSQSRAP